MIFRYPPSEPVLIAISAMSYFPSTGPYPTCRYEAELKWETAREQLRAYVESLPSSSFERTKFDADEEFYSFFPLARRSAAKEWIAHEFPQESWAHEMSMDDAHVSTPTARSSPEFASFSLAQALTLPPSAPCQPSPSSPEPPLHSDGGFPQVSSGPEGREQPPSSTRATMSRRPNTANKIYRQQNVYPPQLESPPSTLLSTRVHSSSSAMESTTSTFYLPQFTGNWEDDAIAAEDFRVRTANDPNIPKPLISLPALPKLSLPKLDVLASHPKGRHRDHPFTRLRHARHHPYLLSDTQTLPDDCPESSDSPSVGDKPSAGRKLHGTQLRDKDGKPILACLFCRGRKIACGPPPNGSDDPTCNQCTRRGQKCFYPTENRRGQRKTKAVRSCARGSSSRKAKGKACQPELLDDASGSECGVDDT